MDGEFLDEHSMVWSICPKLIQLKSGPDAAVHKSIYKINGFGHDSYNSEALCLLLKMAGIAFTERNQHNQLTKKSL